MAKLFKNVLVLSPPSYKVERFHIVVDGDIFSEIVPVDSESSISKNISTSFEEVIDCTDYVMTPGFFNGHIHLNQILNRGVLDEKTNDNLMQSMHKLHFKKTDDDRYWASILSLLEGLESGTTFFSAFATNTGKIAEAMSYIGVRGAFTLAQKDIWLGEKHTVQINSTEKIQNNILNFLNTWQYSNIIPIIGFASDRSASPELLQFIVSESEKNNLLISFHIAEGMNSVKSFMKDREKSPVEYLKEKLIINDKTILIHCTSLTEKDIEIIKDSNAAVCHCPISNIRTNSGIMNYSYMKSLGIPVMLGTDAASTGNTNNILLEGYSALLIHNGKKSYPILNAKEIFNLLTIDAAKIFKLEDRLGRISKGYFADFSLWDINQPLMQPFHKDHILNLIIFSGGQIKPSYVFVNGLEVYQSNIKFDRYKYAISNLSKFLN